MRKQILILVLILGLITPVVLGDREDPFLEISKGNVPGHTRIHKFGHNEDVGTSLEVIWSLGGIYNFTTIAEEMRISSTDVDDTVGGTGVWNITLFGLDANYDPINETIQMNGQTQVNTTQLFIRVNRAYARESGSTQTNEGIIYIGPGASVAGVNANPLAVIDALYGQTMMAIYTIPANCTGYLETFTVSTFKLQKEFEVYLVIIPFGESIRRIEEFHLDIVEFQNLYIPPRPIAAKTDIYVMGEVDVGSGLISVAFDIVEVNNDSFNISPQEVSIVGLILDSQMLILLINALLWTIFTFITRWKNDSQSLMALTAIVSWLSWWMVMWYWFTTVTTFWFMAWLWFAIGIMMLAIGINATIISMDPSGEAEQVV